jgi:hypothetical protein
MPKHASIRAPKPAGNGRDTHLPVNRAPSPTWIRDWRQRIRIAELLNRLQKFALDDPDVPTGPRMTRTQATVALSLLRKVLPDMQALEISGNSEQPITVQVLRFSDGAVIDGQYQQVTSVQRLSQVEHDPRLIEDEQSSADSRPSKKTTG